MHLQIITVKNAEEVREKVPLPQVQQLWYSRSGSDTGGGFKDFTAY